MGQKEKLIGPSKERYRESAFGWIAKKKLGLI
jgi:hypothetical protein